MQKGAPDIPPVTVEMTRELQTILTRMGYDVGTVDGKLGLGSRKAVKGSADQARHAGEFIPDAGTTAATEVPLIIIPSLRGGHK